MPKALFVFSQPLPRVTRDQRFPHSVSFSTTWGALFDALKFSVDYLC
jgi:hypothetical protein